VLLAPGTSSTCRTAIISAPTWLPDAALLRKVFARIEELLTLVRGTRTQRQGARGARRIAFQIGVLPQVVFASY
jgi:hypothetical protein